MAYIAPISNIAPINFIAPMNFKMIMYIQYCNIHIIMSIAKILILSILIYTVYKKGLYFK